jgi:hypothetical protein
MATYISRLGADYTMTNSTSSYAVLSLNVPTGGTYHVTFNIMFQGVAANYGCRVWTTDGVNTASNIVIDTWNPINYGPGLYSCSASGSLIWVAAGGVGTIYIYAQSTQGGVVAKATALAMGTLIAVPYATTLMAARIA